jgi:hypothetical protein
LTITINQIGTGSVPTSFTMMSGTPMSLEAYPFAGWHFLEWRIDGVTYTTARLLNYTPTKSVTLTAVFEIDSDIPQPIPGAFTLSVVNAPGSGVDFAEYRYWAAQMGTYLSPPASPADGGNINKAWVQPISGASVTGYFTIVVWDINSNELHRNYIDSVTLEAGKRYKYDCSTKLIAEG